MYISEYSVFLLVNVQVRQWGAWKLHPSNIITQKLFLIAHSSTIIQILGSENCISVVSG